MIYVFWILFAAVCAVIAFLYMLIAFLCYVADMSLLCIFEKIRPLRHILRIFWNLAWPVQLIMLIVEFKFHKVWTCTIPIQIVLSTFLDTFNIKG